MTGFTEDEEYLSYLSNQTFLRFWSWPNLFRDQGKEKASSDGKEICDLTIIFNNYVILFSDKRIDFNCKKPIRFSWNRWFRRAILNSIKQLNGAKRWILEHPDRIYTDKQCTKKMPLKLPPRDETIFFFVVVCHGIENHEDIFANDGSFYFDNRIVGDEHYSSETSKPFNIGKITDSEFCHVFNHDTIQLVLKEFDTTVDFISYLSEREKLINLDKPVVIRSEADIIHLFYENFDATTSQREILTEAFLEAEAIIVDKGGIKTLATDEAFILKKQEDRISYFWDDLIECFTFHILGDTSILKSWKTPDEIEPGIRQIAKPSRFIRRILSESFLDFYDKVKPGIRGTRHFINPQELTTSYLFLLLPYRNSFGTHSEYREARRAMLGDYCIISKYHYSNIETIIGIAAKTREDDKPLNSTFFYEGQDIVCLDATDWTQEQQLHAQDLYHEYKEKNLIRDREMHMEKASEFPQKEFGFRKSVPIKGRDRNKPCFCGSGLKYKNCCGK